MSRFIEIHPDDPQPRLVNQVVNILNENGVVAYPTSSGYALGCKLGSLTAVERIRQIRRLEEKQDFTLMCASISQVAKYAKLNDSNFGLVKSLDDSKFTFLLPATPDLPRKTHSKRKTVGVRITDSKVIAAILEEIGEPLLSTSLLEPNADDFAQGNKIHQGWSRGLDLQAFTNSWEVQEALDNQIDAVIDSGEVSALPTTVLDLTDSEYEIIRQGAGEIDD